MPTFSWKQLVAAAATFAVVGVVILFYLLGWEHKRIDGTAASAVTRGGGVVNGPLDGLVFTNQTNSTCSPAPGVTWGRDWILRRDNDTCAPLYVPPVKVPGGLTCPAGQEQYNSTVDEEGDTLAISCRPIPPAPPTPSAPVMTCGAGTRPSNLTVLNGTVTVLVCEPIPVANTSVIGNGTSWQGPSDNNTCVVVDGAIPTGVWAERTNATHVCFNEEDACGRTRTVMCVPWSTIDFALNGTAACGTALNNFACNVSTGILTCPPGQEISNIQLNQGGQGLYINCTVPVVVNASNITLNGDVIGQPGSNVLITVLSNPGTFLEGKWFVTKDAKGRTILQVDSGLTVAYTNTTISTTTMTGTVGAPELRNETVAFNCTGGDTLCVVGRDTHGLVVVLEDGPKVLLNTTVFGGGFVAGTWNNLQCVPTGNVAGTYGGQVNNFTYNVPTFTNNACGQFTASGQFTLSLLNAANGTIFFASVVDETTLVTSSNGSITSVTYGAAQPINRTSMNVVFGSGCYGPEYTHLGQTLCITGSVGTATEPQFGVFHLNEYLPRLQFGIFNDTVATNTSGLHPYIAWNVARLRENGTWVGLVANASGFSLSDPPTADGNSLLFSASSIATVAGGVVTFDTGIMRLGRGKVNVFLRQDVGPEPLSPLLGNAAAGINVHQVGNSFADLPGIRHYMTFTPGANFYPRAGWITMDLGDVIHLYEADVDTDGNFRSSHNTFRPASIRYRQGTLTFSNYAPAAAGSILTSGNDMVTMRTGSTSILGDLYVGITLPFLSNGVGHAVVAHQSSAMLEAAFTTAVFPQAQFGCLTSTGLCYTNYHMFVNASGAPFTARANGASHGASWQMGLAALELVMGGLSPVANVPDGNTLSVAAFDRAQALFKLPVHVNDQVSGMAEIRLLTDTSLLAAQWAAPDSDNMLLGLGLAIDNNLAFHNGGAGVEAWGLFKAGGTLQLLHADATTPNSVVTPDVIWDVSKGNTIIINVLSVINTNAEASLWRTGDTVPRVYLSSFGAGNTSLMLDAFVSGSQIFSGSSTYDGMRVFKAGSTLYFQRLPAVTEQTVYTNYQNVVSIGPGGLNLAPADSEHGTRALFTFDAFGERLVVDLFGAYVDESGTVRSGLSNEETFRSVATGGAMTLFRCDGVPLGNVVTSCAPIQTVDAAGISFEVSVALNAGPQLSTVLLPSSGGTGSPASPLAASGPKIVITENTGPEGKMVESAYSIADVLGDEDRDNTNALILETDTCGDWPFNVDVAVLYTRTLNHITVQTFFGQTFDPINIAVGGGCTTSAGTSVFLVVNSTLSTRFPNPPENLCYGTTGVGAGSTLLYFVCFTTSGRIVATITATGFQATYVRGTTYSLPRLIVFDYIVTP